MITIYSSNWCASCVWAKRLLDDLGLTYLEINIQKKNMTRNDLESITGGRTVPQIIINDVCIGGFDKLYSLNRSGELEKLLN
jgi:glutaredoxin 3